MPLVAATLAGPAAIIQAYFERVIIDSADQLNFLQEKQEEHDPRSSNQE